MYAKVTVVAALLAMAEARFGREQEVANIIQGLSNFGNPGQAATLAGQSPGVLLAGANACAKLQLADTIVTQLGTDPAVISAAIALVAAEKNTNPFAVAIPSICGEASLPATEALRGIVPLIDPDTVGSDVENANSASSAKAPFSANGKSVADVVIENGFSNFTIQKLDGSTAAAAGGAGAGAGAAAGNGGAAATTSAAAVVCSSPATLTTVVKAPAATEAKGNNNNKGNNAGAGAGAGGAANFGLCNPSISFELGRPGRKATEGTFLPIDPLVAKGQQDALNPNIITNRVCDQLTNVCEANQAAKDLCLSAKALVQSLGTKDATTADAFNKALGF
ncbi:hypothetical protein QBC47DRAFT_49969 [Echria macrotheca]|uniref:Uncharacterized protein n=1 Tax=Echria macrotheca TaxID=438768 RepID=A0AAJ0BBN4_9PEZI|nr:hypothetical protein QBC47DRAFT_49969 [Echria macrotheca]